MSVRFLNMLLLNHFKRFLLFNCLFWSLVFSSKTYAQIQEVDTFTNLNVVELEDLKWMMDTTFKIFKTQKFNDMKVVFPSFKTYKKFIKKSEAGKQTEYTQFAMYNSFWNKLRLQHSKLFKKLKKQRVDWQNTKLDSIDYEHSYYDSVEFAYVKWIIKVNNKKRYMIKATCIKMDDKWFVMDELIYAGIIIERKEKKKKS